MVKLEWFLLVIALAAAAGMVIKGGLWVLPMLIIFCAASFFILKNFLSRK